MSERSYFSFVSNRFRLNYLAHVPNSSEQTGYTTAKWKYRLVYYPNYIYYLQDWLHRNESRVILKHYTSITLRQFFASLKVFLVCDAKIEE